MGDNNLRQFDYGTITDVIMQIRYTAREDAGEFKEKAIDHLTGALEKNTGFPFLVRFFSLRRDFPTAYANLLNSAGQGELTIGGNHFPFVFSGKQLKIDSMQLLLEMEDGQTDKPVVSFNIYKEKTVNGDNPATIGKWNSCGNRLWAAELFAAGSTQETPLQKWTMEIADPATINKDTVRDIYLLMRLGVA